MLSVREFFWTWRYLKSVLEAANATDTEDAAAVFPNTVTEAVSATDATNAAAVFANTLSEAASATDTDTAALVITISLSESASATDTDNAAAVFVSAITETGAANDSGSATGAFGCAIVESATAADSVDASVVTGGTTYNVSLTEAANATDALDAQQISAATGAGGERPRARGYSFNWRDFTDREWFRAFREELLRARRLKSRKRREEELLVLERALAAQIKEVKGRPDLTGEIEAAESALLSAAETVSDAFADRLEAYLMAAAAEAEDEEIFLLLLN